MFSKLRRHPEEIEAEVKEERGLCKRLKRRIATFHEKCMVPTFLHDDRQGGVRELNGERVVVKDVLQELDVEKCEKQVDAKEDDDKLRYLS